MEQFFEMASYILTNRGYLYQHEYQYIEFIIKEIDGTLDPHNKEDLKYLIWKGNNTMFSGDVFEVTLSYLPNDMTVGDILRVLHGSE